MAPKSDYVLNLSDNVGALKVSSFGVSAGGSADFYDFTFLPQDDENGVACTSTANFTKDNVAPGGEEEVFGLEPGCRCLIAFLGSTSFHPGLFNPHVSFRYPQSFHPAQFSP